MCMCLHTYQRTAFSIIVCYNMHTSVHYASMYVCMYSCTYFPNFMHHTVGVQFTHLSFYCTLIVGSFEVFVKFVGRCGCEVSTC